jgi:hypothetical protein
MVLAPLSRALTAAKGHDTLALDFEDVSYDYTKTSEAR